ncbi:MAG: Glu-tRNA(Gln) amidotransferase subunit GatE [Thaumarchaeota archaeon]|nr:Glu-tRNA(Gln) amidotransferase subunit GatE [Nitrososphaerota archaeon]
MPGDRPGLLVGLEVHQQLSAPTKLFCNCPITKTEEFPFSFERRLRPAQSETGRLDPAAVFEFSRDKPNLYLWSPESSCLVDADEEPPRQVSREVVETGLMVAAALGSGVVDEAHVMRKIVIDGSNTTGFQRTAVLGFGGSLMVDGTKVGVQSITLEEDAARIMGEDERSRIFGLDRLGVPLIEVALDPVSGTPEFVGHVALNLGRVLRSTGRVARGLGTIRQDLNISLDGGAVVEVKGVQKLNLVAKVVAYEASRQRALMEVAKKLVGRGAKVKCAVKEVTRIVPWGGSEVLSKAVGEGGKVDCVTATGLSGLLGWEPAPGFRLGREAAEVARAHSLGGIVHSDEFRKRGISEGEERALREYCGAAEDTALVLVAGEPDRAERGAAAVASRLELAPDGVPAETRGATRDGETVYMRPRPGAQRMYPETDVPLITLPKELLSAAADSVGEPWEDTVKRYTNSFRLSRDLALRLYDSDSAPVFEALARELMVEPSVIASILVEMPPRLLREGVPEDAMNEARLVELLRAIDSGAVAKEAAPDILRALGAGKAKTVAEAVGSLELSRMGESEVSSLVDRLVRSSSKLISERRESALSPLMGELMSEVRGRADGALVSRLLKERLERALKAPRGRQSSKALR